MKKFLRSLLICAAVALCGSSAHSQTTSSYFFSAFTAPYTSISATGTAAAISADDITQTNIPIGFTFTYCGTPYTQLAACSNGFLNLANTGAVPWTNVTGSIASAGWLLAYWDDLHGAGHTAYYQTVGTAPNRIFIFEWNNFHHFSTSGNGNLQIKLYEGSNMIDFCYGANTYGFPSATIGITNTAADVRTLPGPTYGPTPIPTMAFFDGTGAGFPAANQVYRWSPCPVIVSAINSGPACPGTPINLTGTVGGGAISWTWSGPGGFSSN
jgi:hypothetical protein